jgi:ribosomal protein S18 acetylase RimI-like enzyme
MSMVGEIRIAAYEAEGFISADSLYAPTLRGLGADGNGHVLVATMPAPGAQQVVGTIMLQTWPNTGPVVAGPDEAEIRALAVRPESQGMGIGRTLLRHALERAAQLGVRRLVLCTEPAMRVAHRLYEQAGFVRLPERDWTPLPGSSLLVYGLNLDAKAQRT